MSIKIKQLSVFFPAYNEEENIKTTVENTIRVLRKVAEKWEIIIVDDGSKDNTPALSDSLAKKNKNVRVIHHKPNRGYGGALKTGFKEAKYEWVAFTDSDGQFDFNEITKFISLKDEADLILGIRKSRADSILRKIYTWGWALLPKIILGMKAKDYSCGFKMIKKEVFDKVQPLKGEEKVTQIELLVKAQRMGFKISHVTVNHYPRKAGEQTGADIKVVLKSVFDLLKLWNQLRKN
jgi:glycosyltransferase involved in cell wall biosynthesis